MPVKYHLLSSEKGEEACEKGRKGMLIYGEDSREREGTQAFPPGGGAPAQTPSLTRGAPQGKMFSALSPQSLEVLSTE